VFFTRIFPVGAVREQPFFKDGRITMRPYKDGGVKNTRAEREKSQFCSRPRI
jgi:hypothetical protein